MHDNNHEPIFDFAALRLAHTLYFFDQIAEIELVEALLAEQTCLLLSP